MKYNINQFHCFRSGCWCHAESRGLKLAVGGEDGLSYYERKVRDGLIDPSAVPDLDFEQRDELVQKYYGIVLRIANDLYKTLKPSYSNLEQEELVQAGMIGLIEAINSGSNKISVLYPRVKGAVLDYLRVNDMCGMTGVPERVYWKLIQGEEIDLNTQKKIDAYNFISNRVDSLDRIIGEDAGAPMTYHDVVADSGKNPEELVIGAQETEKGESLGKILTKFFRSLGTRDRVVFNEYILGDRTTREVADMIKVKSNKTVVNIANRLKEKLRGKING